MQLRLVVYPIMYGGFYASQVVVGEFLPSTVPITEGIFHLMFFMRLST